MKHDVLHINMLGEFTLTCADQRISCTGNRSKLIWNLLAYLLCHRGNWVSTDELLSVIWKPEKNDNPAGAMRTAIHRARQILHPLTPHGGYQLLLSKNGGYMWNPDVKAVIDTELFEERIRALHDASDADETEICLSALELYNGKFLAPQFSEIWVLPMQTHYHNQYEMLIDRVIPALEQACRFDEGIAICRKAIRIDPYSEKIHRYLMRFLLHREEYQEVIRIYEDLSQLLLSAFSAVPDQETRDLYQEALDSLQSKTTVSPELLQSQLNEQGEITGAIVCDYDSFQKLYQAQARTIVRSGIVIHTVLLTLKSRIGSDLSPRRLSSVMDNFEKHLSHSLRKGDVITRCSVSQFILMLPSANYENSCKVCDRFISSFERQHPHAPVSIEYVVQPMLPSTNS
ncbi:MAG: winged helix-turn-helix domain-containing protein [Clostridia bacterium]|nr:winged helix-turn-helix domain-containing protein [Clostridia bacterium]